MKHKAYIVFSILLTLTIIYQCKTPYIIIDDKLKNKTDPMTVEGHNTLSFKKKVITYGEFNTSKVQKGWMKVSYPITIFTKAEKARQKFSFTQYDGKDNALQVNCAAVYVNKELPLFKDFLSYDIESQDFFAGSLYSEKHAHSWDFIVYYPEDENFEKEVKGYLKQDNSEIIIKGAYINKMQFLPDEPEGYEFILNNKTIAAVETINNGYVWMLPELDEELKLTLAGLSTALLLREDPKKAVDK